MSKSNRIILTPDRGSPCEGIINTGETPMPGQIVQIDPTQPLQGNRPVWKLYNRGASGNRTAGPAIVLREDIGQGKTVNDAYVAGTRAFGFIPRSGCELNLLYKNVAGTADDVLAGDRFEIDNATGKVIVSTGTPQDEVAMANEAVVDPIVDTLVWSIWR